LPRSTFRELYFTAGTVAALASSGCTSSSDSQSLDPPHLQIESIRTPGASAWTRGGSQDCVQFGADAPGADGHGGHTLIVDVGNVGKKDPSGHLLAPGATPVSWTLSPPLTCAGTPPCGYLVLTVDPCTTSDIATCSTPNRIATVVSAGPSIPVSMGNNSAAFYHFHVDLFNPGTPGESNVTPAVDRTGKTYPADVVLDVLDQCGTPSPPLSDGGTPLVDAGRDASFLPDTGVAIPSDGALAPDTGATPPDAAVRDASTDATLPDATIPVDAALPVDAARPTDARVTIPVDARSNG
jgi:hypothetical protein